MLVAGDSVLRGSREPATIKAADWRSSGLAGALQRLAASRLVESGVPLGYATGREVAMHWRIPREAYRAYYA